MSLFNTLLKKIECKSVDGLWWELQALYSDIEDLESVKNIKIKKIEDIYTIYIFFNTPLSETEIDAIIFPYVQAIRYHHGLFYERREQNDGFCYNLITFQENLSGFACRIFCRF